MNELIEAMAEAMADAARDRGDAWCWDEWEGERFLGWNDLADEDMDVGGDHWVKGRDYYRDQARAAMTVLTPERLSPLTPKRRFDAD